VKQATSATGRKWQRYNRWRSAHRELDRKRRLDRIAEKEATKALPPERPKCPMPRRPKAWARVRITFGDGTTTGFVIHESPFGLTISPTLAGRKVSAVLSAARRVDKPSVTTSIPS
jgi:hypothetical protein